MQLLNNITVTTTLPTNVDPMQYSNVKDGSSVAFSVRGVGNGSWSATVNIYPVFLDPFGVSSNYFTDTPIILTVTNSAPIVTNTVNTPVDNYIAIVASITGTVSVSAQAIM